MPTETLLQVIEGLREVPLEVQDAPDLGVDLGGYEKLPFPQRKAVLQVLFRLFRPPGLHIALHSFHQQGQLLGSATAEEKKAAGKAGQGDQGRIEGREAGAEMKRKQQQGVYQQRDAEIDHRKEVLSVADRPKNGQALRTRRKGL